MIDLRTTIGWGVFVLGMSCGAVFLVLLVITSNSDKTPSERCDSIDVDNFRVDRLSGNL